MIKKTSGDFFYLEIKENNCFLGLSWPNWNVLSLCLISLFNRAAEPTGDESNPFWNTFLPCYASKLIFLAALHLSGTSCDDRKCFSVHLHGCVEAGWHPALHTQGCCMSPVCCRLLWHTQNSQRAGACWGNDIKSVRVTSRARMINKSSMRK